MNHPPHHTIMRLAELATVLVRLSADVVEVTSSLLAHAPKPHDGVAPRPDTGAPTSPMTAPAGRRKPASKAEVLASVKVARDVIGQQNRPVQVSALFQEVSARGFTIYTPKPVLTYAARLRDYRTRVGLTYLEGFGWWPVERPYPPANYTPASITRIGKHIV